MQKGLNKLGSKKRKKANAYVPEGIDALAKDLARIRFPSKSVKIPKSQVIPERISEALDVLSKEDRECIERFWGLTGGVNHSKRGWRNKDQALIDMRCRAVEALKKMSKLEIARIYDSSVDKMINLISSKINKEQLAHISDFESVKYLMAYFVVLENGPKLTLEQDPMVVNNEVNDSCYLDEYQALKEMCEELEEIPEQSINLSLIKSLFEMLDFKDWIVVLENFGIGKSIIFKDDEISVLKSLGINVSEIMSSKKIQDIMTFGNVRTFKERIFKFGAWDVTSQIIQGQVVELKDFAKQLGKVCKEKDWVSKIEEFKTGQSKQIRVSSGIRNLDVYSIGGLEFTDPCEIDFLRVHLAG